MQLISDAVTKNVEEEEKSKAERGFESEMNMEMPTNVVQFKERLLDAVYFDDDMDEPKSMIWVQCRRCQWSCSVESYMVGECKCTWGPAEG